MPSIKYLKIIMPFALAIAYTSGLWIILTNIDKLLLSNFLPLKEYGYFSLIAVVECYLAQLTSLISQGKIEEMHLLYKKGTQFISVIGFAVTGIVAFFSTELLYGGRKYSILVCFGKWITYDFSISVLFTICLWKFKISYLGEYYIWFCSNNCYGNSNI